MKVKDGDIVFPVAARGKQAVAQGKVEDLEMSRAKYVKYLEHAAEEQGGKFDEASPPGRRSVPRLPDRRHRRGDLQVADRQRRQR